MTSKELKAALPDDDRPVYLANTGYFEWYGVEELNSRAVHVIDKGVYLNFGNGEMGEREIEAARRVT